MNALQRGTQSGKNGAANERTPKVVAKSKDLSRKRNTTANLSDSGSTAVAEIDAINASATKKRPYRRTKRPAGYNDKSSITTTTETMVPVNVYDAVIAESEDLLQAAAEAQQLGRLRMSSSYLLLLHARLVGLGKRFDKSIQQDQKKQKSLPDTFAGSSDNKISTPTKTEQEENSTTGRTADDPATPPELSSVTPKTAAARELADMLPSNIEFDTAMMEHLAKAAAELHAARSGYNKHHSSNNNVSDLAAFRSPDAREFLAGTANQQGVTNAATASGVAKMAVAVDQMQKAGAHPQQIAQNVDGRTAKQVKNYMKQQEDCKKVEAVALGRGRKPATAAMNTVPNALCDARSLLQGGILKKNDS